MLNKMLVIGHVGADPVMRHAPSGSAVTSFSLATNIFFTTPGGEWRQETEWFMVVAWESLAETCTQYVNKGKKIYVEGRLRSRTWVGRDGQTRLTNEIIASRVISLDRNAEEQGGNKDNVGNAEVPDVAITESYYEDIESDEDSIFDSVDVDVAVDYGYLEDYPFVDPNYEDFGFPHPTYRDLI